MEEFKRIIFIAVDLLMLAVIITMTVYGVQQSQTVLSSSSDNITKIERSMTTDLAMQASTGIELPASTCYVLLKENRDNIGDYSITINGVPYDMNSFSKNLIGKVTLTLVEEATGVYIAKVVG